MRNFVITGAASGLGAAIAAVLEGAGKVVCGFDSSEHPDYDVRNPPQAFIERVASYGGCDVLINCAGINGLDYIEDLTPERWHRIMSVNAEGIWRMAQAFLPQLIASKGTIINIVSNAATMPMTASLAYNASKGAAKIMTAQMARELTRRHGITVFSVSPNKLAGTGMSRDIESETTRVRGWTPEYAHEYQKAALLTGEETPVETVAEFIAWVAAEKGRHKFLTGCDIPYGA